MEPVQGESLNGFLVRVAAANRCVLPADVVHELGLDFPCRAIDERTLLALAHYCRTNPEAIGWAACVKTGRNAGRSGTKGAFRQQVSYMGHPLDHASLDWKRRRVCPSCVASDGLHRAEWALSLVEVCPVHATRLVDTCPDFRCGEVLRWDSTDLGACSCGAPLIGGVEPASPACIRATEALVAMAARTERPPDLLDGLPFRSMLDAIRLAAALAADLGRHPGGGEPGGTALALGLGLLARGEDGVGGLLAAYGKRDWVAKEPPRSAFRDLWYWAVINARGSPIDRAVKLWVTALGAGVRELEGLR